MIPQTDYKREKRRLATAEGRFRRARAALPANPYSAEADSEALPNALRAAVRLFDVSREGLELFASEGYPDTWARWDVAERDAAAFIHRWRLEYEELEEARAERDALQSLKGRI